MKKFSINILKFILLAIFLISYCGLSPVLAQQEMDLKAKINDSSDSIQLKGVVKIDRYNQKVNLVLRDTDVKQVLRMLADKAGWNIIIHESVAGKITLDLMDVTLDKAFEYIMEMKGLTYTLDGNTLIIATKMVAGPLSLNKSQIKPIKIKYLDAAQVANFLNTNIFTLNKPYLSTFQVATSNPRTNQIIIFGNDNDVALAEKIINLIDVKPNIKIFEVNYADVSLLSNTICQSVFYAASSASSAAGSSATAATNGSSTNGFTVACGGSSLTGSPTATGGSGASQTVVGSSGSGVFNGISSTLSSLPASGYMVTYNQDLGKISVTGTTEQISLAEEYIKKIDKREPQVYLEASIIELSEDGTKTLNSAIQALNQSTINATQTPVPTISLSPTGPAFTYNVQSLTHTINALVQNSKARILSNPRIIATNLQASTINISDQILTGITETFNSNTGAVATASPQYSSVGITLTITPVIKPNGYIYLTMNPTYSNPGDTVQVTEPVGTQTFTTVSTRTLTLSNIRVKDGETLLLGGLIFETESKTANKVPFIGDIPFAGVLFKNTNNQKSRRELVIMITPKIIKDLVKVDAT